MKDDEKYLKGELALRESLVFVFGMVAPVAIATGVFVGIENGVETLKPIYGERARMLQTLYVPCWIVGAYISGKVEEKISTPLAERAAKRMCRLVLG